MKERKSLELSTYCIEEFFVLRVDLELTDGLQFMVWNCIELNLV